MLQKLTKGEKYLGRYWFSKKFNYPKRGWYVKLLNIRIKDCRISIWCSIPSKSLKPSLFILTKFKLQRWYRQHFP